MAIKLKCNFCGRGQSDVYKLVVNKTVGICNKCVAICVTTLLDTPVPEATHFLAIQVTKMTPAVAQKFRDTGEK